MQEQKRAIYLNSRHPWPAWHPIPKGWFLVKRIQWILKKFPYLHVNTCMIHATLIVIPAQYIYTCIYICRLCCVSGLKGIPICQDSGINILQAGRNETCHWTKWTGNCSLLCCSLEQLQVIFSKVYDVTSMRFGFRDYKTGIWNYSQQSPLRFVKDS